MPKLKLRIVKILRVPNPKAGSQDGKNVLKNAKKSEKPQPSPVFSAAPLSDGNR
jgi:hypothetical protein